jgi:colanic acid/amylovoran biosynthesis glycosyltransferase
MQICASAHVMLFPSRTAADGNSEGGAPVTLIEAQWLGVPTVVSNHDDLPYVAAPGTPVLPPTDINAWAEVLRHIRDSPSTLERASQASRTFATTHHSPRANARARERLYRAAAQ